MRLCLKNAPKMLKIRKNAPNFSKMHQNFFNFLKMRQKLPLYFGNVSKSGKEDPELSFRRNYIEQTIAECFLTVTGRLMGNYRECLYAWGGSISFLLFISFLGNTYFHCSFSKLSILGGPSAGVDHTEK